MATCPVCGQPLPKAIDIQEVQARLAEIGAHARTQERQALENDFKKRLPALLAQERERARKAAEVNVQKELILAKQQAQKAERDKGEGIKHARKEIELRVQRELSEARRRAEKAERDKNDEIQQIRKEAEQMADRRAQATAKLVAKESQAEIDKLQATREKDHARYEADRARLQSQLDQLSRKLDKQVADQLGKEAEIDLLLELRRAFPTDQIEPVARGKKGADIIHEICVESKLIGRIVYESKNVANWQNGFIAQAKRYQTQYDTPNVLIVSNCFPQKKKGLCISKGIPIVDPHMAVHLITIIREGICEIALARETKVGRDGKAQQLYDYILSDKFVTRFREIAETVQPLRERQQKARDWHENEWGEEASLYDHIDARRREVDSQIRAIAKKTGEPAVLRMARRA